MVRGKKLSFLLLVMCGVGGAWGCSGSATTKLVKSSPFTRPEELSKLSAKPLPDKVLQDDGVSVDTWELLGPLPNEAGLVPLEPTSDPFHAALLDAVAQGSNKELRATQGMDCAAREIGHFAVQHEDSYPSQSVEDFIRRRCGVVASHLSKRSWTFDLKPGQVLTDDAIGSETYADVSDTIKTWLSDYGPSEVGIWFGQREGRALIQVVAGQRRIKIDRFAMAPGVTDTIVLSGELLVGTKALGAMITQGDYEAERCVLDPRVDLPKFRVTCPVNASNKSAIFALYNQREQSIFSEEIFDQMVWPAGVKGTRYEPTRARQLLSAIDTSSLTDEQTYLTYINAVRADAGLKPVTLDSPQSLSASALTPHLFQANRDRDDEAANKIALGLMAGWEVKGDIIDADFQVRHCSDGAIISLVDDALNSPSGRKSFLDEDGDAFAVGEVREGDNLGAMMLIYEFVPQETYIRRLARAWRTLNYSRELSGKQPIARSKQLHSRSEELAKKMSSGVMTYDQGVEALQLSVSQAYGNVGAYAFTYLTHDLDDFSLSPQLLNASSVEGVLMVAPLKIPDYPWTIYAVVLAVPANRLKK